MLSYHAYGLAFSSELELPEVASGAGAPDAFIRFGTTDCARSKAAAEGQGFLAIGDEAYLYWKEVGTFLVRGGSEIIVDPAPDVEESVLRPFILGAALGVLLHQRGFLVLHGSSVAVEGETVAFLGGSGWGKSTIAAAFHARGCDVVSDDVTAVDLSGEGPRVSPGIPQLKLWPDAAASLGNDPQALPRLHPQLEKRACRVSNGNLPGPLPLRCIYVLDEGTELAIEAIEGQQALVELVRHSYVARLLQPTDAPAHLLQCAALARSVPVRRLKRLRSLPALPELARSVEGDLAQPVF